MGLIRRMLDRFIRKAYTGLTAEMWSMSRRQIALQESVTDPYAQNSWVYAGATNKARAMTAAPLIAVAGRRTDEKGKPLPSTDPAATLLATPQVLPVMTAEDFVKEVSINLDTTGNAFALLLGQDGDWWMPGPKLPAQIVPVHPSRVNYNPTDIANTMTGALKRWIVTDLFGRLVEVPAESVVHWKYRNPKDPILGLAPLRAAALGIMSEWSSDQFTTSMLRNGCTPGVVIEEAAESNASPEERAAVVAQFDDEVRGPAKAGKTTLIPKYFSLKPSGQTPRDMELPRQREWSRSQIRAVLGVTEFELGEIADQNRANADAARLWLWTNTLIPTCNYIEAVLWNAVFRHVSRGAMQDVWARFDTSKVQALRGVSVETAQAVSTLTMAGFEPKGVAEEFGLTLPVAADVGALIEVGGATASKVDAPAATPSGPAIIVSKAVGGRRMTDRQALRAHEAWMEQSEALVARKVRAVFEGRAKALRKALHVRKSADPPTTEQIASAMGTPEEWAHLMQESLGDSFARIGAAALRGAGGELGGFSVVKFDDPVWRAAADKRVAQVVKVGVRTRARLAEAISASLNAGEGYSVTKLADEIDAKFGSAIQSNGMVIARTECAIHGNAVRHAAFKAEGVEKKVWRAARDEHTRDTHRQVNGKEAALDELFPIVNLMHPGDPRGKAAEIVQCRCVARPRFAG